MSDFLVATPISLKKQTNNNNKTKQKEKKKQIKQTNKKQKPKPGPVALLDEHLLLTAEFFKCSNFYACFSCFSLLFFMSTIG